MQRSFPTPYALNEFADLGGIDIIRIRQSGRRRERLRAEQVPKLVSPALHRQFDFLDDARHDLARELAGHPRFLATARKQVGGVFGERRLRHVQPFRPGVVGHAGGAAEG